MKIAFLYAYSPSGHSRAADALQAQLKESDLEIQTQCLELTDLHPFLGPIISQAYLELVQKTPKLWDYLYDNQIVAQALHEFREELSLVHRRKMRDALDTIKPDCIVCTHAVPCATLALEKEQKRLRAPLIAVPTDFGIHAYWISKHVDSYLVPNEEVRDELIRRGIDPSRIHVTGIPIDPRLRNPLPKSQARKNLGLNPEQFTILVSGGSKGIGPIQETIFALETACLETQILVACGKNQELFQWLQSEHDSPPHRIKALAFTEEMPAYLAAADILIGKAGGLSASEALSLGLPMIVLAPLPGQEERNSKFLTDHGAALRVEDPQELGFALKSILSDPSCLDRMRRSALRLGRPFSAQTVCEEILRLLEREKHPSTTFEKAQQ